ncbi:MAG TPA: membrane protein insertion efficiency factor YidD [Actinomycetota bacterium]
MSSLLRRAAWIAGAPFRFVLLMLIGVYRLTLGKVIGGNCRFYPSCSAYAEGAIANAGWARGLALSAWRLLRCNPFSKGGVDHPPARRSFTPMYDSNIRTAEVSS